jgi:hypothetical protein
MFLIEVNVCISNIEHGMSNIQGKILQNSITTEGDRKLLAGSLSYRTAGIPAGSLYLFFLLHVSRCHQVL